MTVCIDDRGTYGRVDLPLKEDGKKWNLNTAYMPEFCDMIIDMGKKGASWAQMVAACEVGKQTAEKWKARFPDWEYAVELAMTYSEAWFDKTALDNMCWVNSKGEPQFRSEVFKFQKQTIFGTKEKQDQIIVNMGLNADTEKVSELISKLHADKEII